MKQITLTLVAMVPAIASLGAVDPAGAPGVRYSDTVAINGLPWSPGVFTLDIPQFNLPGTLLGVHWELVGRMTGDFQVRNASGSGGDLSYSSIANMTVTGANLAGSAVVLASSGDSGLTGPANTGDDIAPGGYYVDTYDTGDVSDTGVLNAGLAPWIGNSTVSLNIQSSFTGLTGGSVSTDDTFNNADAQATFYVYYTYDDNIVIPEPGTYVGALALLGVGAMGYRRMRRA